MSPEAVQLEREYIFNLIRSVAIEKKGEIPVRHFIAILEGKNPPKRVGYEHNIGVFVNENEIILTIDGTCVHYDKDFGVVMAYHYDYGNSKLRKVSHDADIFTVTMNDLQHEFVVDDFKPTDISGEDIVSLKTVDFLLTLAYRTRFISKNCEESFFETTQKILGQRQNLVN